MLDHREIFFRDLWQWLLIPFIIGLMTLSLLKGLSKIMILYGLGFVYFFSIFYFFYYRLKLPLEVFIYFGWIIWSLGGWFIAIDQTLYLQCLMTVIQIGALIFLVAGNTALYRSISIVMSAIAIGGIILLISGYVTGDFQLAGEIGSAVRATGIAENANQYAYHLLFLIFAMFFFWETNTTLWWRIFLSIIITASVIGIILSGSRKGFLGALTFLSLWFLFCQGKKLFKKPIVTVFILLILIGAIYYTTDYVLSSTFLGKRFENRNIEHGSEGRIWLYMEGFDIVRKNPILGVGLDNYRILSTLGMYSHSDYMEVVVNTGIVGFILYFSIYVILWRRLNRISTMTDDPRLLYIIGVLKAAIITILLVAFGRPNTTSKLTWLFLAAAIGYSWSIEQDLLSKLRCSEPTLPVDSE